MSKTIYVDLTVPTRRGRRRLTATRLPDATHWAVDLYNRNGKASDGGIFDEATVVDIAKLAEVFGLDAILNAASRAEHIRGFTRQLLKSRCRPVIIKSLEAA